MGQLDNKSREVIMDLFIRYRASMLQVAGKVVKDKAAAEDCVETVFHRLLESKPERVERLKHMKDIEAYMLDSAYNAALDYLALYVNKNRADMDLDLFNSTYCNPEEALEMQERNEKIRAALNKVKPSYLEVLMMDARGYSTKEIAEMLEITVANVKVRRARGKRMLRRLLEKECKKREK